jgi:two-component system sensor histidine kinase TctE
MPISEPLEALDIFWKMKIMTKVPSLKRTIVVRLIFPLIIFIIIETILSYYIALHYVNLTYDRWLLDSAYSLAQEVKNDDNKVSIELPDAALKIFTWDNIDTTFFKVISEKSGLLKSNQPALKTLELSPDSKQPVFSDTFINGKTIRMVSIQASNDLPENVSVHVAETLNKRRLMTFEILMADLIPQLLLTLLISTYLFKGVSRGLEPLNRLSKEISRRSPNDLNPISESHVFAEVKILTDTINNLLEKLSSAIAAQQRFIANAAHQLRTPLAGLKLQAERADREKNIGNIQPALFQIQKSADKTSHIIAQLLVLTRSDPIEGTHNFELIDLQGLAKELSMEWVPKALKKNIELSFESPTQSVLIHGDRTLLTELINNLLDNAVKYSKNNGNIMVKLLNQPVPCLIVEDDGPGIENTEYNRIFERFYRIPGSTGTGCGLGLAIVKEIANLHQAKLSAGKASFGGLQIELQFKKIETISD